MREEKSFSQRFFSIYTDIRKLQDKTKTSSDNPGVCSMLGVRRVFPARVWNGSAAEQFGSGEQVETIDKKYLPERRGAVSDDVVMTKLTKALQIQIGAVERYN